jgi:small subunit ribosomal protein S8
MLTDPIADMLTRIRNAIVVKRPHVDVPSSKLKRGLAEVLKREGYIWDWQEVDGDPISQLRIELKYGANGEEVIQHIKRVSTPGRRVYKKAKEMRPVLLSATAKPARRTSAAKSFARSTSACLPEP